MIQHGEPGSLLETRGSAEPGSAVLQPLPEIAVETIPGLVAQIEKSGFAVIPDYIAPVNLAHLQSFVEEKVAAAGGEYVGLVGKAAFQGTMLDAIADSPAFTGLIHRLYQQVSGKTPPPQSLYQVLRCLKGKTGLPHSYYFHFDSYVVTVLLPIIIPDGAQAGHLVMIPNLRKIRRFYLLNMFDKLILERKLVQRLLRSAVVARRLGFVQVPLVPGNLYVFWGYRTLHANEPCDPDRIRATALFHFADPHAESSMRQVTGQAKVRATPQKNPVGA